MANPSFRQYLLDARADRLDLRDRKYRPHLGSLPAEYPKQDLISTYFQCYKSAGLILDQGTEGACTGFGLAATINYLIWRDRAEFSSDQETLQKCAVEVRDLLVSERMLYHNARIYDEWDGEDYSGSSCRGAMKGWHRHGVCTKKLWPYTTNGKFAAPNDGWAENALQNPLGAYYRINKDSIVDMQAAIVEVGAIYCSSRVHQGWQSVGVTNKLPHIKLSNKIVGGHAYCIVGYNRYGFIVQNSWGVNWGWQGFALLTYQDWVEHGNDAWVVARGVPIEADKAPEHFSHESLQSVTEVARSGTSVSPFPHNNNFAAKPWTADIASQHSLIIGNNGRPRHTVISAGSPDGSAESIVYERINEWMQESAQNRKVVFYAHGGLNDEEAALKRVQIMGPYFKSNGIYPVFLIWKTGLLETLGNILKDAAEAIFSNADDDRAMTRSEGWADRLSEWATDKTDGAIEATLRSLRARAIWSEMKENAEYASDRAVPGFPQNRAGKPGALVIAAKQLAKLKSDYSNIELHIAGHSAGSIILGAWLDELHRSKLKIVTTTLYAPACSIQFAVKTYGKAIERKQLAAKSLHIDLMDDEMERDDNTAGIYRKSLLYLVSRALEDTHKKPLLGLHAALDADAYLEREESGRFSAIHLPELKAWQKASKGATINALTAAHKRVQTSAKPNPAFTDLAHGSFDNDISVVSKTLKRITGKSTLKVPVKSLQGY